MIPVTKADSQIDLFDHDYKPLNEKDKKNWQACKYLGVPIHGQQCLSARLTHRLPVSDDPVKYDGAPAAVQILGRRLEEEKLLSVAQRVVEALRKYRG